MKSTTTRVEGPKSLSTRTGNKHDMTQNIVNHSALSELKDGVRYSFIRIESYPSTIHVIEKVGWWWFVSEADGIIQVMICSELGLQKREFSISSR